MEKIEKGVVVEYAGKYWGLAYDDGNNKSYVVHCMSSTDLMASTNHHPS